MVKSHSSFVRPFVLLIVLLFVATDLFAIVRSKSKKTSRTAEIKTGKSRRFSRGRRVRYFSPWTEPTYADSTAGDNVDGEDLTVRRAAVEALGGFNGAVVVTDPTSGRILTMVNQRLALSSGYRPCSTVKVPVALAALQEGLVERTSKIRLYRRLRMDLTDALAHSNNPYFARLGVQLGYERFNYYARLLGYGERAGLDIPGEQPGTFPSASPKNGGMGMLTTFGEDISQTPLQLAAIMTAVANGGTLYYLQYPRSQEDLDGFVPRVKRQLEIRPYIDEIKPGMQGAVEFGTAKRARQENLILGKTGTCSEGGAHLGWFGSFNEGADNRLVVVVLLTGGRPSIGPAAAAVAGDVYRLLGQQNYFASARTNTVTPATIISSPLWPGR